MATGYGKTETDVNEQLTWGKHYCHFYETKEELLDILIPYFNTGLEKNEFCLCLLFEPLNREDVINALKNANPKACQHLEKGSIEIIPYRDWYFKNDTFDVERVINNLNGKLMKALIKGYTGLRLNGSDNWVTENDRKDFVEYEKKLSDVITDRQMLVLCTYPMPLSEATQLFDIACSHEFVLTKGDGNWEVMKTPELRRAKSEIEELSDELEHRVRGRTRELETVNENLRSEIIERNRAESENQKLLHDLNERVKELTLLHNTTRILQQNQEDIQTLLREITELIPLSIQYPQNTAARMQLGSAEAVTQGFRESPFALRTDFTTIDGQSGSIEIIYTEQSPPEAEGQFLAEERALINTLADMLRTAYDRQTAEKALRESEERYRTLVKAGSLIVWSADAEGKYCKLPGWAELTGQPEEEAYGDGWLAVIHTDDREKAARDWEEGKKTQSTYETEYRVRAKDGSYRYVVSRVVPIIRNGRVCEWIGAIYDVTERKLAEQIVRRERDFSEALLNSLPGVFYLYNEDLNFLRWNKAFEQVTGYSATEIAAMHPLDFFNEADRKMIASRINDVFTKGMADAEADFVFKDGSEAPYYFTGINARIDGKSCLIGVGIDITERKLAEDARRKSQQQYESLVESIDGIVWEVDTRDFKFTFVSKQAEKILGYPVAQWLNEPNFWVNHTHPSDRNWTVAYCKGATDRKEDHQFEYRMISADGRVVWLRDIVTVHVMEDNSVMLRGVMVDITERKQTEEQIRQSESQLAEAQRLAHIGSWNIDLTTNILTWSDQLYYICGLTPQKFTPTRESFLKIVHPEDRDMVINRIEASYRNPEQFNYYYRIIRTDGKVRILYSKGTVAYDEYGNPVRSFGTVQDVTERKLAEEQLTSFNQKLRALSARLQSVREEESINIAREIHDNLGGALTGLKMDISWLNKRLPESANDGLRQKLKSMSELIDETVQKVRNISTELRPSVLDDLGLAAAIEWQAREFQKRTEIECSISSLQEDIGLSMQVSTAVFRIFQEILTNVARHANATRLEISLHKRDDDLVLKVSDNGRGIKETDISETKSLGLLGMRERAIVFGGQVEINGINGKGTTVTVSIPRE